MYLHRQMTKLAAETDNQRREFLVTKLLSLISDKSLRAAAEKCADDDKSFAIECNFVDEILDDPRIERRLQALNGQGIEVAPADATLEVAGHQYTRRQLSITF